MLQNGVACVQFVERGKNPFRCREGGRGVNASQSSRYPAEAFPDFSVSSTLCTLSGTQIGHKTDVPPIWGRRSMTSLFFQVQLGVLVIHQDHDHAVEKVLPPSFVQGHRSQRTIIRIDDFNDRSVWGVL